MFAASQGPGITEIILGLIAYGCLFAVTIKLYRKNRPVILGVLTVSLFFAFLLFAMLDRQHTPAWMHVLLEIFIVLCGLAVLGFVAVDVFHWAKRKAKLSIGGDDLTTGSKSRAK